MTLKNFLLIVTTLAFFSCNERGKTDAFKVAGNIAHVPDQKIYLEQIYFNNTAPEVLDTGNIKNGKFIVSAKAEEEGLFRLRLEKDSERTYFFINDQPEINLTADPEKDGYTGYRFSGQSNGGLSNLLQQLEKRQGELNNLSAELENLKTGSAGDSSLVNSKSEMLDKAYSDYKAFLTKHTDTAKSPIVSLFSLMYMSDQAPEQVQATISGLAKRFPKHKGLLATVDQFKAQIEKQKQAAQGIPAIGQMAPDFTLGDENRKPFALSSLRGKYVLVDFWASWCGPCRGENPNVVKAYNAFKDKNFTILGVSLDKDESAWKAAIQEDGLTWKHVSDLQYWNSAVVPLYKIDGIPYNVLVDPTGKIIATALRGDKLIETLEETIK